MTDFDDKETPADDDLRPIPDGGLSASMPAWLRESPAWAAHESPARVLPAPDTSVIDPRTMVRDEDLPDWLREISARSSVAVDVPEPVVVEPVTVAGPAVPIEAERDGVQPVNLAVSDVPEVVIPGVEGALGALDVEAAMRKWIESGEPLPPERPQWKDPVILALVAAGIVIVVLVVTLLVVL